MQKVIGILFLLSLLALVFCLYADFRRHDKFERHFWRVWGAIAAYAVIFPLAINAVFQKYPEAIRDFFPDGLFDASTILYLLFGWIYGLLLWLVFKLFFWIEAKIWMWRQRN